MQKLISVRHTRQFRIPSHSRQIKEGIRDLFKHLREDAFLGTLDAFSGQGVSPLIIIWLRARLDKLEATLLKYGKIPVGRTVNHNVYFKPSLSPTLASKIRETLPLFPRVSPCVRYLLYLLDNDDIVFDQTQNRTLDLVVLNMTLRSSADGTFEEHIEALRTPPVDRGGADAMDTGPDRHEDAQPIDLYRTITAKDVPSYYSLDKRRRGLFERFIIRINKVATYFRSHPIPDRMTALPKEVYNAQRGIAEMYRVAKGRSNSFTGQDYKRSFEDGHYAQAVIEGVEQSGIEGILLHGDTKRTLQSARIISNNQQVGLVAKAKSKLGHSRQVQLGQARQERIDSDFKRRLLALASSFNLDYFNRRQTAKPQNQDIRRQIYGQIHHIFDKTTRLKRQCRDWQQIFNGTLEDNPEARAALGRYFLGTYDEISREKKSLRAYFEI
jgi:hypothetical protein